MPLTQGTNWAKSLHYDELEFFAMYLGNGAADLLLDPGVSVRDNFDKNASGTNTTATGSRQSTGLHLLTMKQFPPKILDVQATLRNPSGTHRRIQVLGWNETATPVTINSISVAQSQVLILVTDTSSSDNPAEAASTDAIRVQVIGRESTV